MLQRKGGERDRSILIATGFLRAVTTSVIGITLGLHVGRMGLQGQSLGVVVSAGFLGGALAAAVATLFADRIGRRRFLLLLTLLNVVGTLGFAWSSSPWVLAAAAFVGMLNGMGKDRGAALIVEQAAIPSTTTNEGRTRAIAFYTMLQDLGHALGALLVGAPGTLNALNGASSATTGHRPLFVACAATASVSLLLYAALDRGVEYAGARKPIRLSPRSRGIVARISALFAVDSLAGGFLTTAMLSYFFYERFGVSETVIGVLFFGARLMNAVSHLGAAWLAKRIGLVNTMVFTHIPSSLLLVTVAFTPSFAVAAALFLLREGLVEMDVPTRQSYVLAVVEPGERTLASGITGLVRLGAWAVAPVLAGPLMTGDSMHVPLVVGAVMKISYDVLLWRAFRSVRPPEEVAAADGAG